MKDIVSENAMSIIRKMQQYELDESIIYEKIAKFAKGDENKKTLRELSKKKWITTAFGKNTQAKK